MTAISRLEDAINAISAELLGFAGEREWDAIRGIYQLFPKAVFSAWEIVLADTVDKKGSIPEIDASDALTFIRSDHIQQGLGELWGLTFTLYPDGTYHIEYDYQKPADYEDDLEDTIDGDEINQRLQQLQAPTAVMPAEQAYQQIGYCLLQALGEGWQQASIDIDYRPDRQVMMHFWQYDEHGRQQAPQVPPQASMVDAANAAYALQDNLLAQGGQAPQGLTLHLDPGGKMQLHYHYAS